MDVKEELKFFRKFQKKKNIFFFGGVGGSVGGVGLGWGVGVDVNEIEVFVKIQKKKFEGGVGGSVGGGGGVGLVGRGRVGGSVWM